MIFGYILISRSGLPIAYKLFVRKEIDENRIGFLSSAVIAIIDFFKELLHIEPDNIVGGEHKMNIAIRDNIVLLLISDKNDFMAERIANKFADLIERKIRQSNIDLSILVENEVAQILADELSLLDSEIQKFNESAEDISYI